VIAAYGITIPRIMSIVIARVPCSIIAHKTAEYTAKPQDAMVILVDVRNGNAVACLPRCLIELYMDKLTGVRVQLVQSFAGANPEIAVRITEYRFYIVAAQAGWNAWIAREATDAFVDGIKTVQPCGRGYPNPPTAILAQRSHIV
jgi:hypothetical protein